MSETPAEWLDVLGVDAESVARVGYSLAAYADDYELPRLERDSRTDRDAADEDRLMVACTLTEAATLLAVVDAAEARARLAQAAALFEQARAPEAWVVGMAAGGAWEPSSADQDGFRIGRPSDAMSLLAGSYASREIQRMGGRSGWGTAIGFGDNPRGGWTALGAPATLVEEFVIALSGGPLAEAAAALDQIVGRSDEAIRMAQEIDSWRWQRFVSAVPLLDPELLALGCLASRFDFDVTRVAQARPLTPARVAVLAGMRLARGEDPFAADPDRREP